jgi:hypothetical protein
MKLFNAFATTTGAFFLLAQPTLAGSYQALCGGANCTIIVSGDQISSPYGSIPTNRVTNWGGGGNSSTQVGTGVATTLLLGPIGLLGFLAKKHDFNFLINGYDQEGKKTSIQLQFVNDKPAKRFINEMQMVTQLGMGQTRSASQIMSNEVNDGSGISTGTLEGDAAKSTTRIEAKSKKAKSNCWSNYLDNNPAMKSWAEANPGMAKQNQRKFDDC